MAPTNTARSARNTTLLGSLRAIMSDSRFLQLLGQAIFLILVLLVLAQTAGDINRALSSQGITTNFTFLSNRAGFAIAGAEGYSPNDSYWEAFQIGLANTMSVVVAGLTLATILGILWGVFLLSSNWLIRNITRFIVELLRNTPLLVQIFVWFFVIILALPQQNDAFTFPSEGVLFIPWRYALYVLVIVAAARSLNQAHAEQRTLREMVLVGALAAFITLEVANALRWRDAEMLGLFDPAGALAIERLVLYLLVSLGLIIGAWVLLKPPLRSIMLAAAVGQLIAGFVFLLGALPNDGLRLETSPAFYLSNRGFVSPQVLTTGRFSEWFLFVVVGITVAVLSWIYLGRIGEQTGEPQPRLRYALISIVLFSLIGWLVVSSQPAPSTIVVERSGELVTLPLDSARAEGLLSLEEERQYSTQPFIVTTPEPRGLRIANGQTLDQRYLALVLALVTYTAAFIAEIVRAGILAVPPGQTEAARALGLNGNQVLQRVILPQALRVIIPPLGNQYLNLAKNSSLAFAIAYADVFAVVNTIINQSGQSVSGILIIMATYLVISLTIAAIMNWVNGRFQIVTR